MSDKIISSTTQEFLDVYDIINDMVLLKDGTASVILQVGTMNFSLLAEQEQDAIIFTYGSLLNSLNYPIQISIQSQTKDVTKYLRLLDEQVQKASSDRKATLIKQYRNFVAALIKERNVLEKHFYVTIPVSAAEMGLITPSSVLPGKSSFDIASFEKSIILEKAINILEPRRDHLMSQFNRLGLYTRQLNTQEIIQNFYINYNPEAAEGQEISNNENYTTPLVRASFGGKIMQTNQQNPTPEEILSSEPATTPTIEPSPVINTEAIPTITVTNAPVSTFDAPIPVVDATPTTPVNPPAVSVQTEIEQTNIAPEINNSETPATEILASPQVNVDLNLDPSLISGQVAPDLNSKPEPIAAPEATVAPEPTVAQEPIAAQEQIVVQEATTLPEPPTISEPIPEVAQANVEEVRVASGGQSDFAEEITPMQGNLEVQNTGAPVLNTEENKILEPQI